MKFSIKDIFSKCDQIGSFLRIWSHLLKKSLIKNFTFCAVLGAVSAMIIYKLRNLQQCKFNTQNKRMKMVESKIEHQTLNS